MVVNILRGLVLPEQNNFGGIMKITETNGSYKVILPKAIVEGLGWKGGTILKPILDGKKVVLKEVTNEK